MENGWNGDDESQLLGVYTYIVKGQFNDNQEIERRTVLEQMVEELPTVTTL